MIQWQVIEAQVDMPAVGAITLYVSLLTFTLRVHPGWLDYCGSSTGMCNLGTLFRKHLL